MRSLAFLTVTLFVAATVRADIYFHNPRGSNNRLNEKTADRDNANRAFDSQVIYISVFYTFKEAP